MPSSPHSGPGTPTAPTRVGTDTPDERSPVSDGLEITPFQPSDVAELLVLQRCCWVQEAIANDSLAVPPCPPSLSSDPPMQRAPGTFAIPRVGARNVTL